jgi:lantibiotic modifying enzyme
MNNTAAINCDLIYEDILHMLSENDNYNQTNLFAGKWGTLLYLFYYEKYHDGSQSRAGEYLESLYEQLDTSSSNFAYCTGLSGPVWLLSHLSRHGFIDIDLEELTADFIEGAIAQSEHYLSQEDVDFLHGSGGICYLLLDFAHRKDVRAHLHLFVDKLASMSVPAVSGRSFPTFHPLGDATGIDAFSLAHGTCAHQLILLRIHQLGIQQDLCAELIQESMRFILAHQNANPDRKSALFPASLNGKSTQSKVSWCYGDLNVGFALWRCGQYFNNTVWKDKALEVFRYNTGRNCLESAVVSDVCFCHGTAGNAAMYLRIAKETGDPQSMQCALDWYQLTEKMLVFPKEEGQHGVEVWRGDEEQWQYDYGILNGSAGVGLALLNQITGQALPWDELFLLA